MERNFAIDALKLILACFVIGLHCVFLSDYSLKASYLLSNGLFRIAVPIFFIINGYYFYHVVMKDTVSFWFKRVIQLYLLWMIIYSPFWLYSEGMGFAIIATKLLKLFFGYYHLWYLSAMIGAGLLMFLLRNVSTIYTMCLIFISFLVGTFIQYSANYSYFSGSIDQLFQHYTTHRNFLFFAFPFFGIGYLIKKDAFNKFVSMRYLYLGLVVGLMLVLLESYINLTLLSSRYKFDLLLSLIIICPTIFLLVINMSWKTSLKDLSTYSTSLYLIHILVMNFFLMFSDVRGSKLTFAVILISLCLSFFIVKANKTFKVFL